MLVHQFFGSDDYSNRTALVFRESEEFVVMFIMYAAIIAENVV